MAQGDAIDFEDLTLSQQRIALVILTELRRLAEAVGQGAAFGGHAQRQSKNSVSPSDLLAGDRLSVPRPNNVYMVDGARGSGKTTLLQQLETLALQLGTNQSQHWPAALADSPGAPYPRRLLDPHHIGGKIQPTAFVLPQIYPDLLEAEETSFMEQVFGHLLRSLESRRADNVPHEGREEDGWSEEPPSRAIREAPRESGSASEKARLRERLVTEVSAGWLFAQRSGQEVLSRDSLDFTQFANERAKGLQKSGRRHIAWARFVEAFLDHFDRRLLVLFIDDCDSSPDIVTEILKSLRLYLSHPRIAVVLGGNFNSFRTHLLEKHSKNIVSYSSILSRRPAGRDEALQLENSLQLERFAHTLMDRLNAEVSDIDAYLGKILPPPARFFLEAPDALSVQRIIFEKAGKDRYSQTAGHLSSVLSDLLAAESEMIPRSLLLWGMRYEATLGELLSLRDFKAIWQAMEMAKHSPPPDADSRATGLDLSKHLSKTPTFQSEQDLFKVAQSRTCRGSVEFNVSDIIDIYLREPGSHAALASGPVKKSTAIAVLYILDAKIALCHDKKILPSITMTLNHRKTVNVSLDDFSLSFGVNLLESPQRSETRAFGLPQNLIYLVDLYEWNRRYSEGAIPAEVPVAHLTDWSRWIVGTPLDQEDYVKALDRLAPSLGSLSYGKYVAAMKDVRDRTPSDIFGYIYKIWLGVRATATGRSIERLWSGGDERWSCTQFILDCLKGVAPDAGGANETQRRVLSILERFAAHRAAALDMTASLSQLYSILAVVPFLSLAHSPIAGAQDIGSDVAEICGHLTAITEAINGEVADFGSKFREPRDMLLIAAASVSVLRQFVERARTPNERAALSDLINALIKRTAELSIEIAPFLDLILWAEKHKPNTKPDNKARMSRVVSWQQNVLKELQKIKASLSRGKKSDQKSQKPPEYGGELATWLKVPVDWLEQIEGGDAT